ncbi:MAG: nicotinamide mononucleotide transporter [Pseudomonadota bacterium]|nr:nicotinamide mononucleotide transporter [Pseudomonadota bacterium]
MTFPEAASYPWLDALTTVMSLVAMWLMARRRIESWVYWIIVDVIGIGLYFVKEVRFVALLYAILLALAIRGLIDWRKASAAHHQGWPQVVIP